MKVPILLQDNEVETLEILLGGINIHDGSSTLHQTNVKLITNQLNKICIENVSSSVESVPETEASQTVKIVNVKEIKKQVNSNENLSSSAEEDSEVEASQTVKEKVIKAEDESAEETSDDNDEEILKRGPSAKKTTRPSPYDSRTSHSNQKIYAWSASSHQLYSGGDILQSDVSILEEGPSTIPDLDMLLGDRYPVSDSASFFNSNHDPLGFLDNEALSKNLEDILDLSDLSDLHFHDITELDSDNTRRFFEDLQCNDGFNIPMIPKVEDYPGLHQFSPQSTDTGYSTSGSLDARSPGLYEFSPQSANTKYSTSAGLDAQSPSLYQFSPLSTDTGYSTSASPSPVRYQFSPHSTGSGYSTSASPDARSVCDSPFSPEAVVGTYTVIDSPPTEDSTVASSACDLQFSQVTGVSSSLPVVVTEVSAIASCSTPARNPAKSRKKRNPFFEGLDEKDCDNCRRAILLKAKQKDGLNVKDIKKRTLLHIAIEGKHIEYCVVFLNMLEKSFENGTGRASLPSFPTLASFLDQEDDYGRTPLHTACINNLPRVVEYLLKCKVTIRIKDNNDTVLHYMCQRGMKMYDVAEKVVTKYPNSLHMINNMGETPLHIALAFHGRQLEDPNTKVHSDIDNLPLIKLFLKNNAKLSCQDVDGRTPLHFLVLAQNFDLLEMLYLEGRDWNEAINIRDAQGKSILHLVAQDTSLDPEKQNMLVEKLMVRYADARLMDDRSRTPRDYVPAGRVDLVRILSRKFQLGRGWYEEDFKC